MCMISRRRCRGFLLRRLCTISFENLGQFNARELTKMAYSLAKLRRFARRTADEVCVCVSDTLASLRHLPRAQPCMSFGPVRVRECSQ